MISGQRNRISKKAGYPVQPYLIQGSVITRYRSNIKINEKNKLGLPLFFCKQAIATNVDLKKAGSSYSLDLMALKPTAGFYELVVSATNPGK